MMNKKNMFIAHIGLLLLWSAALSGQNSLYSDIKARKVGDVISVIIAESANASRESSRKNNSSNKMDVTAKASGNVASFLPLFGGSSSLGTSYDGKDGTAQKDKLTGRMTVRIVEISPEGMYRIEGERKLDVNGEENTMEVHGFIRPRDISTKNTVFSYNIANAEITYKKGGITNLVNDGFFGGIFTKVLSIGMVAAALGYLALK